MTIDSKFPAELLANQKFKTSILATKLLMPHRRQPLVSREMLNQRIEEGLSAKLTLVSAPAGFGKSTLLTDWAHYSEHAVSWLSLDAGDNSIKSFFTYLTLALQEISSEIGQSLMPMLQLQRPPTTDQLISILINDLTLYAARDELKRPKSVLVLDDYYLINEKDIHRAMDTLLSHSPSNLHIIIATRTDPELHLSRLRGRGQLTEIRSDDLRFNKYQGQQFLSRVMNLDLDNDRLVDVMDLTEGWIAGLQIVAVYLKNRIEKGGHDLELAMSDSGPLLVEYLTEEVVALQPADIRHFLMRTSIVEPFCASLCDALTGSENSQQIIKRIDQANLFLIALDSEQKWYRYHRLFSEALQANLIAQEGETLDDLHLSASSWYENEGMITSAINHQIAAGSFESAASLINEHLDEMLMQGELIQAIGVLEQLPEDVLVRLSNLRSYLALLLLIVGRSLQDLQVRFPELGTSGRREAADSEWLVVDAVLAALQGKGQLGIRLSKQALVTQSKDRPFLNNLLIRSLGASYRFAGDANAANEAVEQAISASMNSGDKLGAAVAYYQLAEIRRIQGKLHEAIEHSQKSSDLVSKTGAVASPILGRNLVFQADIYREWNRLDEAAEKLSEAKKSVTIWGEVWGLGYLVVSARLQMALGNYDIAIRYIGDAKKLAVKYDATEVDDAFVEAAEARLYIAQGFTEPALVWRKELDTRYANLSISDPLKSAYHLYEFEQTTLARLLLTLARPGEVLELLSPLQKIAAEFGRTSSVIEIQMLQAIGYQMLGQSNNALSLIEQALITAEPEGIISLFLDEGRLVRSLLDEAAANNIAADYCGQIINAGERHSIQSDHQVFPTSASIESLTWRESQILTLLSTHLSTTEMAAELGISVNTVRFHIKNIYSKLQVHGRSEAVVLARDLGLLL